MEENKMTVKGTPEYARSCCEASLKCLQVDYIDLYYVHRIDTTVPIEETVSDLPIYGSYALRRNACVPNQESCFYFSHEALLSLLFLIVVRCVTDGRT